MDQLSNERHVNRPRHDVNAVRADVRSNLNFPNDDCFFGKNTASSLSLHWLRHTSGHLYSANTRLAWRFRFFFENLLEHIDHLAGIRALQLDELAHYFCRRHVHLFDYTSQLSDNVGVLRYQETGRFWQSQNIDGARASLEIRH